MINFKKGLNLKVISLIIGIQFLFNVTLYSCPIANDSLRIPIGQTLTYRRISKSTKAGAQLKSTAFDPTEILSKGAPDTFVSVTAQHRDDASPLQVATSPVTSQNGITRRALLGGAAAAAGLAAVGPVPALRVGAMVDSKSSDVSSQLTISDEGIAFKVVSALHALKREMVKGTITKPADLLIDLNNPRAWQAVYTDLSESDSIRTAELYRRHNSQSKGHKKNMNISNTEILEIIADSIRDEYQKYIDIRSIGSIAVDGFKFSIREKKRYPSQGGNKEIEVLIVEPLDVFQNSPFVARRITGDKRIILVYTEINLFIDEVVIPSIYGVDISIWKHRLLTNSPRLRTVLAKTIRDAFRDMSRQTIEGVLENLYRRHEYKHIEGCVIDSSKVEPEIEALLKTWDPSSLNKKTISEIASNLATELDPTLDELEGDYPEIAFIQWLEFLTLAWRRPTFNYLSYLSLVFILRKLCDVDISPFLYSRKIAPEQIEKLKSFITVLFEKDTKEIRRELNNFAYKLRATLSKQAARLNKEAYINL